MFGELILNCDLDDDTTIDVLRMLDDGVIKEIIDRGVVEVPRTFMPSATQFAVADDGRFFCLAHSAGMYHILLRRKWFGGVREKRLEVLTKDFHWLSVRGYGCRLTRSTQRQYFSPIPNGRRWLPNSVIRIHGRKQKACVGSQVQLRIADLSRPIQPVGNSTCRG